MLRVQRKQCSTCIYRRDSQLNIKELERQIADPRMEGHFRGSRICHHSKDAVCAGFWRRHKDNYDAGQLAQRLNLVVFVHDDVLGGPMYVQYELKQGDSVLICWLKRDRRLKVGNRVTLKGIRGTWVVNAVYNVEQATPPTTKWQVGGLE